MFISPKKRISGPVFFAGLALLLAGVSASAKLTAPQENQIKMALRLVTNAPKPVPPACAAKDDATQQDVEACRKALLAGKTPLVSGNPSPDDVENFLIANVEYYKKVAGKKAKGPEPSKGEWKNATAPSSQLLAFLPGDCKRRANGIVGVALAKDPKNRGTLTLTWRFNNEEVYHDTDAKSGNECTLFFTKSSDGKNGRIVGYGFHTDEQQQSKYKLNYIDPAWNVPANIDISAKNPNSK